MATIIRFLSATGSETVGYIETVVASVCIFGFEAYAHPILCINFEPGAQITRVESEKRYPVPTGKFGLLLIFKKAK
uniref:Uncharacterized protein n=1 Tax=Romanomermis culicivorax TaxID=13658 RepID=A0A915JX18_ROMCU